MSLIAEIVSGAYVDFTALDVTHMAVGQTVTDVTLGNAFTLTVSSAAVDHINTESVLGHPELRWIKGGGGGGGSGDNSILSLIRRNASAVLPPGFQDWFTDFTGANEFGLSATVGGGASVTNGSGLAGSGQHSSVVLLTSQSQVSSGLVLAQATYQVVSNPSVDAWYIETRGRPLQAITATGNSQLCSVYSYAGGFVGLAYDGATSLTNLQIMVNNGATSRFEDTGYAFPDFTNDRAYTLYSDGAGMLHVLVDGVEVHTSTNFLGIPATPGVFVASFDQTSTVLNSMLLDYVYIAGQRNNG